MVWVKSVIMQRHGLDLVGINMELVLLATNLTFEIKRT